MSVADSISQKLKRLLQPQHLDVINESHLHAGHRSSPGTGDSHFRIIVVSEAFTGRGRVERHQDPLGALDALAPVGVQLEQTVAALTALPRRAARHRALELLERVHFPNPKQRYGAFPHELSGGQLQRVGIALALAGDPKVLLADEPTTALDVSVQSRILALLRELRDDIGAAIVLVTHDIGAAGQMADRLAVMYAGRWVEHGTAEAVLGRPRHPYTRALIGSYSGVRRGLRPLPHLKGAPPTRYAAHPRQGCPLAPRCPEALPRCSAEAPPTRDRAGSVSVCWLDR